MTQAANSAISAGAQAFAATGNPWIAAGAAALGFLSGNKEQKAKNEAMRQALELRKKQNELIIAETARGIGELNRQRTALFLETNRALQHAQKESGTASADVLNQYSAVDQVGASVLVAQSEANRQLDEASAMIRLNNEIQNDNINTQVINLTNGGQSQLGDLHSELNSSGGGGTLDTIFTLADSAMNVYSAKKSGANIKTTGAQQTTNQSTGFAKIMGLG